MRKFKSKVNYFGITSFVYERWWAFVYGVALPYHIFPHEMTTLYLFVWRTQACYFHRCQGPWPSLHQLWCFWVFGRMLWLSYCQPMWWWVRDRSHPWYQWLYESRNWEPVCHSQSPQQQSVNTTVLLLGHLAVLLNGSSSKPEACWSCLRQELCEDSQKD